MSDNKLAILKTYTQAWNDHDIETIMAMMADDCTFYAIAGPDVMGTVHRGREKVRAAFESAWQNFPDAAWRDGQFYVLNDHQAMSTSRFTGTDSQGGKHEAQMVDLFVFEGDKISVKNAFRKNRPAISGD